MVDNSTPPKLAWLKARIDALRIKRGLTEKWLYEKVDMTKTGYRQMWERDTLRVVILEDIARHLGTTLVRLMIEEEEPAQAADAAATYGRPRYLEERMDELEAEVRALKERLRTR
jgi:DNA-binding Xre family transcriptional regulator